MFQISIHSSGILVAWLHVTVVLIFVANILFNFRWKVEDFMRGDKLIVRKLFRKNISDYFANFFAMF